MNSHQQIIKKINEYSKNKIPFLLIVDFEMQKPLLFHTNELIKENISVEFPDFSNVNSKSLKNKETVNFNGIQPSGIDDYKTGFDTVMQHVKYGNSYLTNLTGRTKVGIDYTLSEIFDAAHSKYKILFKDEWVCFSPECFIKIEDSFIYSFPMKGTIDANLPKAEETILDDKKEIAEHYTIVDLIRNDLSMVAENVVVERFRYIDKISSNKKDLLQVSSKIKGVLPMHYEDRLGEVLFSLLPAGSISGAPKAKTVEIIREAEQNARGYYTGVAFYFDGKNVDSCVLIRFIEKSRDEFYYRSGGGITVNSEMEKEYQELLDKIYVPVY